MSVDRRNANLRPGFAHGGEVGLIPGLCGIVPGSVAPNLLGKSVLVPDGIPTGFGAGIFAGMAAGFYPDAAAAQAALCLPFKTYQPRPETRVVYDRLYKMFKQAYFAFGTGQAAPALGEILPYLKKLSTSHTEG